MKKQINPVIVIVSVVILLVIVIAIGVHSMAPPPIMPGKPAPAAAPKMINGHPVPPNVPYQYYTQHSNGQTQNAPP